MKNFASWLGELLGQPEHATRRLLNDKSALHFLLAWTLFESKCFNGYVQEKEIQKYANLVADESELQFHELTHIAEYFHHRYQNKKLLRNLLHQKQSAPLQALLEKPMPSLAKSEIVYLVVFVLYRFRNNMFHGNKGIESWLHFKEQIDRCTKAMQVCVASKESRAPTMQTPAAA
jgi:hypothetical protein